MTSSGRLLVAAPHATRTGSTRVLVDLLGRLAPLPGGEPALLVGAGGPLLEELTALGSPPAVGERPTAIWCNSVLALPLVADVDPAVPRLVYVHEAIEVLEGLDEADAAALRAAAVVACVSEQHRGELEAVGVAPDRLVVVPPVCDPAPVAARSAEAVRRELLGPDGTGVVLGCGEASWRKGADLFLAAAARMAAADPGLRFAWAGRRLRSVARILDHDTERLGLAGRLRWLGDLPEVGPHLAAADVLLLPSRVDPQPLVPLEAAEAGTPTVAFAVGGLTAVGEAGAAALAPYPDTGALADRCLAVLADPAEGQALVAAGRARRRSAQAPEVVVPRMRALIERLVDQDAPMSAGTEVPEP